MNKPSSVVSEVSKEEVQASTEGPAAHANKFIVSNLPAGMRLSFLEMYDPRASVQFRSAVLMAYPDVMALRDLLTHNLELVMPPKKESMQ